MGDGFLSIFKSRAVVVKTQDLNDNDKIVWLFSEKLGKVSAVAKGAKKSKSKFLPCTQTFCYGEFVLFKGKSMYSINECEIIDSFQGFLKELETLTYASYLNELIDISLVEQESNRDLFQLFVSSFYLMKNKVGDLETLIRAFEVKLLRVTGYGLNLDYCCLCRKKINSSKYLNFQYFGGVCPECEKSNGVNVSPSAYNILNYLNKTPISNVYRLNLATGVKNELKGILNSLISQNYAKKPKSLEILELLKGSD
ncbi:MAG: DNA repair protein RecO [Bacillota bacterium]|nr:DNA repair protein RecO [Bacillota bacterium]